MIKEHSIDIELECIKINIQFIENYKINYNSTFDQKRNAYIRLKNYISF